MRSGTILNRYELFAAAGVIAAHATAIGDPGVVSFRQRDVRFLFQLFANWTEKIIGSSSVPLKNTQILRYLEALVEQGFLKADRSKKQPEYRLTRAGLLELVSRIVQKREENLPDQTYFLCYFLKSYRDRLLQVAASEGATFPESLRLELESLLDVKALLKQEISRLNHDIAKLSERVTGSMEAGDLAGRLYRDGAPHSEIVKTMEKRFPYELNSQKPLSELLAEIPPALAKWELEVGNKARAQLLWQPSVALLIAHRDQLVRLQNS